MPCTLGACLFVLPSLPRQSQAFSGISVLLGQNFQTDITVHLQRNLFTKRRLDEKIIFLTISGKVNAGAVEIIKPDLTWK
jgi:hypothetical protein